MLLHYLVGAKALPTMLGSSSVLTDVLGYFIVTGWMNVTSRKLHNGVVIPVMDLKFSCFYDLVRLPEPQSGTIVLGSSEIHWSQWKYSHKEAVGTGP